MPLALVKQSLLAEKIALLFFRDQQLHHHKFITKIKKLDKEDKAKRQFSIGQLNPLLDLHLQPIKFVVYKLP